MTKSANNDEKAAEAGGSLNVLAKTDDGDIKKRETWSRKIDFLLACIGFSVGLGNVWRFPYLCYKNGGGAFLIPYFLFVIIGGIPMFYLEVSLGQFMSEGGFGAWRITPVFQGIGIATTIIVFLLNCYYNVILTWSFRYLFASFQAELPWSRCGNWWNTDSCRDFNTPATVDPNATTISPVVTTLGNISEVKGNDAVTEYWERNVLQINDGIESPGVLRWDLALCLVFAWIVVYFCIWKGIRTSGKVMYFTATSPYLLMTILLIRGVTLDGAVDGIVFYLNPNMTRLMDMQVWVDAGTQIFFSYSISLGALTALGSYNTFHHNSYRDSIIFAFTNSGTSFFAGFVIFSTLGFMAKQQGVSVAEVAESGPGLAFIAYPKALSQMPVAPFWSILFFFMLILLGLDSQFVGVEGFVTAVVDQYPHILRKGRRREMFVGIICFLSFLVGLSMVTESGMYVFQLFDHYSGSRIILVVAFFECIAISYIYGINTYWKDIEYMIGYRPIPYMKYCWLIVTPIFNLAVFGMSVHSYSELTYTRSLGRVYQYPTWAVAIGWGMACMSIIWVPIVAIYKLSSVPGTFMERWTIVSTPILKERDADGEVKITSAVPLTNPGMDFNNPDKFEKSYNGDYKSNESSRM